MDELSYKNVDVVSVLSVDTFGQPSLTPITFNVRVHKCHVTCEWNTNKLQLTQMCNAPGGVISHGRAHYTVFSSVDVPRGTTCV